VFDHDGWEMGFQMFGAPFEHAFSDDCVRRRPPMASWYWRRIHTAIPVDLWSSGIQNPKAGVGVGSASKTKTRSRRKQFEASDRWQE